eukprot:TRINITY_DN1192_c0_g1_i1.p1 TRINITY_DN1192_c0_g1~~TRINITY_DN1192_c0_g1_i1.p1  ORF type:complete len:88 (-),score=8.24 TRINITY_DN1192_c0_g1_i1:2-265(-)
MKFSFLNENITAGGVVKSSALSVLENQKRTLMFGCVRSVLLRFEIDECHTFKNIVGLGMCTLNCYYKKEQVPTDVDRSSETAKAHRG